MYIAGEAGLPAGIFLKRSVKDIPGLLFSHARGGMEFFLKAAGQVERRKTVILPAYICNDFLKSIYRAGFSMKFYEIDDKFNPVLNDLAGKIDQNVFAVVVVHFFGFLCPLINRIITICRNNDIKLIEDFAHCLFCDKALDRFKGDAGLFSLRKEYPVADGGLLLINDTRPVEMKSMWNELGRYSDKVYRNTCKLSLKNYMQRLAVFPRRKYQPSGDVGGYKNYPGIKKMSRLSENIFRRVYEGGCAEAIRNKRRQNYSSFVSAFDARNVDLSCSVVFESLNDGDVPYMFPLRCNDNTYDLVSSLRRDGIPAINWPTLDRNMDNYESAEKIRRNLLFFPLHENIEMKQLEYMIDSLNLLQRH